MNETVAVEDAEDDGPFFKYRVPIRTEATGYILVAAKDEDDAEEKAFEQNTPVLCIACSGGWSSGQHSVEYGEWEIDGDIEQIGDAKDEDDWEEENE